MWHSEHRLIELQSDVARFLDILNASSDFFEPHTPILVSRAPGRLDLMGGIADYSGSLVLELPLAVATLIAVQSVEEPLVSIASTEAIEIGGVPLVTIPLEQLCPHNKPLQYKEAHSLLTTKLEQAWAAYVAGVLVVLQRELHVELRHGLRIMVHCEVPIGKGVSSSAALEVATIQALCTLLEAPLEGQKLAHLCQIMENFVVGAPCGIMDHMTSACGIQDNLLALLCQPMQLQPSVQLPEEIEVWGIDSDVRHTVLSSDYTSVRVGAFMGYRIIAEIAGLAVIRKDNAHVEVTDPLWNGYLANIPPSQWEMLYRDHMPCKLSGKAFLEQYSGSTDTVTYVQADRVYAVRQPTAHPIYEHHRVQLFRTLLAQQPTSEEHLTLLGELMYQSHASYSACGLGAKGTDRLVELVRHAGAKAGLYGAKITGGGSGGTIAVLARKGSREQIRSIAAQYEQETGRKTTLLENSSSGAVAWGIVRLVNS